MEALGHVTDTSPVSVVPFHLVQICVFVFAFVLMFLSICICDLYVIKSMLFVLMEEIGHVNDASFNVRCPSFMG